LYHYFDCTIDLLMFFVDVFWLGQKRLSANAEQIKDISECTHEFEDTILKEAKSLENFASAADEMQMKSIAEFKKAYEVI
jgi:hypothetical protein